MTDIAARLRASDARGWFHPGLAEEAADEIEKLTEALFECAIDYSKGIDDLQIKNEQLTVTLEACQSALRDAMSELTEARDEIERLRAQVRRLQQQIDQGGDDL
jgi:peptidoglycan hydrolase CwlO-like protein